jgi:tRNA threonylcarbamoyladenosine biosynthesis protein TsaE
MKKEEYRSRSASQTKRLGEKIARQILAEGRGKAARVMALTGGLGGGKTTFVQGFARGLGVTEKVLSPTFVILKKFEIPVPEFSFFYHLDCYRIQGAGDILALGFREIVSRPGNIVAVEWAEKLGGALPAGTVNASFEIGEVKERLIKIKW